jgi:hypothetical protein
MKKIKLLYFIASVALFTFSGCDKDVVSTPVTVSLMPNAQIVGNVTAELNLQTAGLEVVPSGTMLLVEVFYADINPVATDGKWSDTVTVASDGKFSVSVPADAGGVSVNITPFSFETDQIQAYGAFYKVLKKNYSCAPAIISIRSGQTMTKDFTFVAANLPSFVDLVNMSGKCQANLNAEQPGLENVPDGTVINFYTSDWKDSVKVVNGTYSINIPNKTVNYKAQFAYAKRVWNVNSDFAQSGYLNINYKFNLNGSFSPVASTNTVDLSFGEGTDMTVDPSPNITVLSGTATADLDLTVAGLENMPDGTKIYFTTGTWGATAVVSSGKYTVSIPRYVNFDSPTNVTYYISFNANRKTITETKSYNYNASGSISTVSAATKTFNITAN